jgi:hypothetical protein
MAGYNYTLKYRTFDELVSDVAMDFEKFDIEGMIQPQTLIKIARKVNYDLGLRIYQTKEVVLEVEKGFVKLPDDFYVFNFGLICGEYEEKVLLPQGTHVEERYLTPDYKWQPDTIDTCTDQTATPTCQTCNASTDPCNCTVPTPCVQLDCKGNQYTLVQTLSYATRTYKFLRPFKMIANPMSVDCDCPNLYWESPYSGWIKNGYLYTNMPAAKVYMNYQGNLQDENGNLLVPDHEKLNEYYEYALKKRILENLIMNGEIVNQMQIQLIEDGYKRARNDAKSFVNTPNFAELKKLFESNRKAMYYKYFDMFRSYPGPYGSYRNI